MRSFFMNFTITILGCGAATPTLRRNPTSQILNIHDKLFLVDCAEGTQLQLRKYKIKFQKVNHIFISHLHGDHYLGLIGLMSSMHLLGRTKELHIHGPKPLENLIQLNLEVSDTWLNYKWTFHQTNPKAKELIVEDNTLEVYSIPLKHRIDCTGFVFKEKPRKPKVSKETIAEYSLSISNIRDLKNNLDVILDSGEILKASDATIESQTPRTYAFCSDTAFFPSIVEHIGHADLLYHEATFTEEHAERAKATFHSTASQAATIAAMAEVKKLVIGHYSSRYTDLSDFIKETEQIFSNVVLASDGLILEIQ